MCFSQIVLDTFEIEQELGAEFPLQYFVFNHFEQFIDLNVILQRLMVDSLT